MPDVPSPSAFAWDEAAAAALSPLQRLAYRARLLGADPQIASPELGSVSAKLEELDPFTAQPTTVLWVSPAGADLRTLEPSGFSSLYLDSVLSMEALYLHAPEAERGPRSPVDRRLAGMYGHCAFNLNPAAPTADAPLHAFLPGRHADLTHPEALMAVALTRNPAALAREIYADEVAWLPWQRPGLDLALKVRGLCAAQPALRGILLGAHGFITWADDDRACYEQTLRLAARAAEFVSGKDRGDAALGGRRYPALAEAERRAALATLLPWLRGRLGESSGRRLIAHVDAGEVALRWVNSQDGVRLSAAGATVLANGLRRARVKPLHIEWDPQKGDGAEALRDKLTVGLARFRRECIAYYRKHKRDDSPPIHDPNPSVILIPGLGLIAWGGNQREARSLAQWTLAAMSAARGAEALDKYQALPAQDAFDIEYATPAVSAPEPELARRIVAVIGAGHGIGRELAGRLAREGACVICADGDHAAALATAATLGDGAGIGLPVDLANRASVRALLDDAVLAYGGLDGVALAAGLYLAPDADGRLSDEKWRRTFEVNVMGAYLVADEAARIWREQALSAAFVLTASAHAAGPGSGGLAFEVSKAAMNQLVRDLATELAPLVRVNAVAPASVVQGSGMFSRERVTAIFARHEIAHRESETDEALREKLARFYAERTLLQAPVLAADAAEALYLLLSERLSKTTGQIVPVDGGARG